MWCHVAEGVSMMKGGMDEKRTSLSTRPELNPTPLEPWTAVYSNVGCFLGSKGKQWKVYPYGFCVFSFTVALTVPDRKGKRGCE